jgi:hypothetical protein
MHNQSLQQQQDFKNLVYFEIGKISKSLVYFEVGKNSKSLVCFEIVETDKTDESKSLNLALRRR